PAALARVRPSGLNATDRTAAVWPRREALGCPVLTSHSRTDLSWEALARVRPSGLNATEVTRPACPGRVALAWPVLASQSRTLPSRPPAALARVWPSGLNATG